MKFCNKLSFLIILLSLVFVTCSKSKPNYYKSVYLDGRSEIIGKNPISDNLANKTDCYHLVYNNEDKIVKVEYLKTSAKSSNEVKKLKAG